jgi:HK97 family phage major capsid protein
MDRIKQLEADRDERRGKIKALLDAAGADKRALTDEERTQADALTNELDAIAATHKLEAAQLDWDRTGAEPLDKAGEVIPAAKLADRTPKDKEHSEAVVGRFFQAVAQAYISPSSLTEDQHKLLGAATGLNTAIPSEGGFLVSRQVGDYLMARTMEEAVLAPRCWSVPIGDGFDGIELPYIDETSRATGSRWGGVQVYRRAEAETVTATKPKFGRLDLRLEDLMGICYVTDRGIRDATSLGAVISKAFPSEMAFALDAEIISGTGVGQCMGILTSPGRVTVAKEGGQTAATIVGQNAINMRSRLNARKRAGSVWLINQECEPQLYTMSIPAGGTSGALVWMPAGGISGSPYDTLFGMPVLVAEQCEALGTEGDIIAANLGEYMLINKGGIDVAESIHVRFLQGEKVFRFTNSVNGMPTWKLPLTPYKGSKSTSAFVTLAVRA